MESLEHLIPGIMSDDRGTQLASTIGIRDMVTTNHSLRREIIRTDVVSRLVLFLTNDDFPAQLKHEAVRLLANMTLHEDTQLLVNCGTVPLFVQLINADTEEDRLLAVKALGNIAVDSTERRDLVLSNGALMTLLSQCAVQNQTTTMLREAKETLTILCGGRPCPPLAQIQPALPVLERFLQSENSDLLFLSSALLACFFGESDNDETRQTLMCFIPRLIELFEDESEEIHKEVIWTIFFVLTRENRDHSQVVINQKPIPGIASFLTRADDTDVKIIASNIVYTIATLDPNQHGEVIDSGVLIPLLQDHDPDLMFWGVQTISTVTSQRNPDHISLLVTQGCIGALCDILTSPEQSSIPFALSALEDILGVGQDEENVVNPGRGRGGGSLGGSRYSRRIVYVGGLEKINALKASQNENIKGKAINIMAEYFNEDKKWW